MPATRQGRWGNVRHVAPAAVALLAVVTLGMIFAALSAQPQSVASVRSTWPTLAPHPDPPVAVFIGDARSAGVGASETSKRWTTRLSAAEGWQEVNVARAGTGYLTTAGLLECGRTFCPNYKGAVLEAIRNKPQIVVVAGGQNDQLQDPVAEQAAIAEVYHDLRAGLPDAQIIAVGPATTDAQPGKNLLAIDDAVRLAATDNGALYVSLLNPPVIQPGMVPADKGAPDDAAHAAIEQRVAAALSK